MHYVVSGGLELIHNGYIASVKQFDGVIVLVNSSSWILNKWNNE